MKRLLIKQVLAPGKLARRLHRAAHYARNRKWRVAARAIMVANRFLTGVEISPGAAIGKRVRFRHGMGIVIGARATIGDGCIIYQNVTIGQNGAKTGMPTLGRRVVVYSGAVIAGPIHVGDGAVIGANSVVLRDVPAGATAVGVPAQIMTQAVEPADEPLAV